ncbi:hypothetical protein [Rhodopirellula sp. MGV]|uniref:hypothetical protein n=1 Tax=Rhodopirellula sp. MGV TaxID=2023130 RepID=UPI000B9690F6|nr:hypothetical protein [Rhodopirellula sp. MGV]OYP36832.1 hypothetical protein CGZ80_07230 [Rhodopirellula sp. MGV]PNY36461.1 hypothetical protein C2E31_12750 [Rhodopirellula baltica]
MKLLSASIRKLFREDFSGEAPILVDRSKLHQEAKRWQELIAKIDGCKLTKHPGDRDTRSHTLCRFGIPEPDSDATYYRNDELRLEYDDERRLTLKSYDYPNPPHTAVVSDLDEIKTFVRHVLERYAKKAAAAKKREKVRLFKSKAIIAQVRKLAKEEQFDFATTNDTVKLKLYVKLAPHEMIEIHVPFKQFEKVLPKLRSTILNLRELYSEGLRFKMQPTTRFPWNLSWVEHHTL